jgi:hypothetical protein
MGVIIIALIIGWCCDAEKAKKDADLWYDKGYEEGYASCLDKYGIEE